VGRGGRDGVEEGGGRGAGLRKEGEAGGIGGGAADVEGGKDG